MAQAEDVVQRAPSQVRGLRVRETHPLGPTRGKDPANVRYRWMVNLKNETNVEIASVTLQMTVNQGTPVGRPTTIDRFLGTLIPHTGSLLPQDKGQLDSSVYFEVPKGQLIGTSIVDVKIVSVGVFRQPDLHDTGHLFTALLNNSTDASLTAFKRDPSLLRVRDAERMTTTLIAFGAAPVPVIKYVLAHGGNVKDRSRGGSSIMHLAIANHRPEALSLAHSVGGPIDDLTKAGRTPLMKAVIGGRYLAWRWLLSHGADPNRRDDRTTAASYAVVEGQDVALRELVKAGARRNLRDKDGSGWMQNASRNRSMFPIVASFGVPVDDRNPKTGVTALMLTLTQGDPEGTVWLIQHGADPEIRDNPGRDSYAYARKGGVNLAFIVGAYKPRR